MTSFGKFAGVGALTVLLVVSLFVWTLPFRENQLPFGEGDSAWHFAIGDNIAHKDKASWNLPYYVALWYAGFNTLLGNFAPEYPPSNHVNYALMQVAGGERFVPVLIYRALASVVGALGVFFILWRLFGVLPAFVAGLGLTFSTREQLMYLFGQQPTIISIAITPVAIYAFYKYLQSVYESGDNSKAYLFIAVALLATQYLLHFQGFFGSAVILAVMLVVFLARFRKFPLSANWKPLLFAAVFFVIIAAPFLLIYLGSGGSELRPQFNPSKLLGWGISPDDVRGNFPPDSVSFSAEYPGLLPYFLFLGIFLLFFRLAFAKSKTREFFMLSWLIGVYVVLHFDAVSATSVARLTRMLVLENYLFYSLIALGAFWLPSALASFLKLDEKLVFFGRVALSAVLVILIVDSSGSQSLDRMKSAYSGIERITPLQAQFAQDVLAKLPEKAFVYDTILPGQPGLQYRMLRYPKIRWMLAISQRYVGRNSPFNNTLVEDMNQTYYLFDYSDIALFAQNQHTSQFGLYLANELGRVEQELFANITPVYNANNIRLYQYHPGLAGVPT